MIFYPSLLGGNIDILHATNSADINNEQTHAKATINATVRNEYVEVGTAVKHAAEAAQQLKRVKDDYNPL